MSWLCRRLIRYHWTSLLQTLTVPWRPGLSDQPIVTQGHSPDSNLKLAGFKGLAILAIQGSDPQFQPHTGVRAGKGLKQILGPGPCPLNREMRCFGAGVSVFPKLPRQTVLCKVRN